MKRIIILNVEHRQAAYLASNLEAKGMSVTCIFKATTDTIKNLQNSPPDLIVIPSLKAVPASALILPCKYLCLSSVFNDNWTHGVPELDHNNFIDTSDKVYIPHPFVQAAAILLAPLVSANVISQSFIQFQVVGGYTAGGVSSTSEVEQGTFESSIKGFSSDNSSNIEIAKLSDFKGTILGINPVIGDHPIGVFVSLTVSNSTDNIRNCYYDAYFTQDVKVLTIPKIIKFSHAVGEYSPVIYTKAFDGLQVSAVSFDNICRSYGNLATDLILRMVKS